jgi:hypothetical protein
MSILNAQCQLFDPIRITTSTKTDRFIIDTWFSTGLIARSLFERLPDVRVTGNSKLPLSSGMTVDRPAYNSVCRLTIFGRFQSNSLSSMTVQRRYWSGPISSACCLVSGETLQWAQVVPYRGSYLAR